MPHISVANSSCNLAVGMEIPSGSEDAKEGWSVTISTGTTHVPPRLLKQRGPSPTLSCCPLVGLGWAASLSHAHAVAFPP